MDTYDDSGVVGANNAEVGGNITINVNGSKLRKIVGLENDSYVKGNVNINSNEAI